MEDDEMAGQDDEVVEVSAGPADAAEIADWAPASGADATRGSRRAAGRELGGGDETESEEDRPIARASSKRRGGGRRAAAPSQRAGVGAVAKAPSRLPGVGVVTSPVCVCQRADPLKQFLVVPCADGRGGCELTGLQ